MDYKFNSENLEFMDDSFIYKVYRAIWWPFGYPAPEQVRLKGKKPWILNLLSLEIIGKSFFFDDPISCEVLIYHSRQYRLWIGLRRLIFAILLFILVGVSVNFTLFKNGSIFLRSLAFVAIFFLIFILIAISGRLFSKLMARIFAESLCAATVLYVLLFLSKENSLTHPYKRKLLLSRVNYLAEVTLALSLTFASRDTYNQLWVKRHFKKIELQIREKECWIIAPADNTLVDLREYFYNLAPVYITGNYGKFPLLTEDSRSKSPKEDTQSKSFESESRQSLAAGLIRFLGFILPLIIMGLFLWKPDLFSVVQIDPQIVSLIFIAWFLLTLDINLKLGVIDELVQLAKGIRELG